MEKGREEKMSLKKILVDLERLKYPHSGLGQFCHELGKTLSRENSKSASQFDLTYYIPKKVPQIVIEQEYPPPIHFERVSAFHKLLSLQHKNTYDLWHSTHQNSDYFPIEASQNKKPKIILTIHDLNFLGEKSNSKIRDRLGKLQKRIDQAAGITFVSEFTKKEVKKHLSISDSVPNKVIHNGTVNLTQIKPKKPEILNRLARVPGKDFIFTIGVIKPKKNFHVLIPLMEKIPEFNLYIAGNDNHVYVHQILAEIKKRKLENQVYLLGDVTEEEKVWLYKNCTAFAFPSLLEGFGLPVLEAMSFGKPVFISNYASLPEISNNLAWQWTSFLPEDMKKIFLGGLENYSNTPSLKEQIISHSQNFSWQHAAREYLEFYQEVLFL